MAICRGRAPYLNSFRDQASRKSFYIVFAALPLIQFRHNTTWAHTLPPLILERDSQKVKREYTSPQYPSNIHCDLKTGNIVSQSDTCCSAKYPTKDKEGIEAISFSKTKWKATYFGEMVTIFPLGNEKSAHSLPKIVAV